MFENVHDFCVTLPTEKLMNDIIEMKTEKPSFRLCTILLCHALMNWFRYRYQLLMTV